MDAKRTSLVAEIGCVHGGSLSRAVKLIELAASNGADAVKSQKRNPYESVPEHMKASKHPNPNFSFGSTYLDHRLKLELNVRDHQDMCSHAHMLGIMYGCSVWDFTSAQEMSSVSIDFVKIPSALCTDFNLLNECMKIFSCPVHISTGMTNMLERESLYNFLKRFSHRCVVYHTTSEYPCPFSRLYLKEIPNIVSKGFQAGFSNHGYGIAADIAAMTLGATWIERHFVDDRSYPHTDAAASLEPSGLATLSRDLQNVSKSLCSRPESPTEEEVNQIRKLRP
jgi:N-acetylneuraminate synthase